RDHQIHVDRRKLRLQQGGEERRERELAAKLERVHKRIGGKIVRERRDRCIERRRSSKAPPTQRGSRRGERAARTAFGGQPRKLRVAVDAKKRARDAAAQETAAAEKNAGKKIAHAKVARMWTVAQLAADLAAGPTTSRELVKRALERIADPKGEGSRAFIRVYAEAARADAETSDRLRKAGVRRSAVDGMLVSLKDLLDVAGAVTRAGSRILENAAPAAHDARAVARLRAAGAVLIGRTNMVEFAFGGVGLNPHYGTPKNPYERN